MYRIILLTTAKQNCDAMTLLICLFLLPLLLLFPLTSCGLVIGAGASTGTAAMEERGLSAAIDDKIIQTQINAKWLNADSKLFVDVSSSVREGHVLLAGNVQKPEHRVEAVRIAWSVEGVHEVINQIEISERTGVIDFARDAWITTKLMVKLTVDSQVRAINYSIDTVDGHVFIMGIAQNQKELKRVQAHAQDVSYVRRVTSHAILKNDPSRRLKVRVPPDVSQK